MSPFALPLRPNPAKRTSSFSSTKFKQPSLGTVFSVSDFFALFLPFFFLDLLLYRCFLLGIFCFAFIPPAPIKRKKELKDNV